MTKTAHRPRLQRLGAAKTLTCSILIGVRQEPLAPWLYHYD